MKTIIVLLIAISLQASCYKIKDTNLKYHCQAVAEGKHTCHKITSKDARYNCQAQAYGDNVCYRIQNTDSREYCKALTGRN